LSIISESKLSNLRARFGLLAIRFAIAACAGGGEASLARAGSSDWDTWSLFGATPATEQPLDSGLRAEAPAQPCNPNAQAAFGVLSGAPDCPNFFGDLGGLRTTLQNAGLTLKITENAELFGNVTGGTQQGFSGNGLTTMQLELDTKQAFHFDGGTLHVSALHIWGGYLTSTNLLALQTLTGIEANASLRLWELWYDQKFGDKFDVKIGEQSIDQEFMISPSAGYFLNSAMGWPVLPAVNLPGGGPAYPLASLGVRGQAQISDAVTALAGVYSGSPLPRNSPNTQLSNPSGVSFPLDTGVLAIAELQYAVNGGFPSDPSKSPAAYAGIYKLGAWYDSEPFDDLQFDDQGVPLASPLSDGVPATHIGDYSIYALADQMIWGNPSGSNQRYVTAFVRPMFTPLQDRSLLSFSINGGLTLHQPFASRPNDVVGLGFGVAQVSSGAANFDRDMQIFQPSVFTPVRGAETFLEATYQWQLLGSVQIQPDIQYYINPGGGIANPNNPTQRVKNELVFGVRTNITF
jgi:porin